jgi:hypothetical protein
MLLASVIKEEGSRSNLNVAEVFRRWLDDYREQYKLSYQQTKIVNAILKCRTAALGGYLKQCDECGKMEVAYCACKDRHCPNCGHFEKAQWLEKQKAVLLPVPYYQTVFTIDHVFNPLVWSNKKELFNLVMKTAAKLLKKYGKRYLGGKIGFTAVLHTWGQTMQAHLHVHFMVSGGALVQTEAGARWQSAKKRFLFPVKKLSRDFRKAFCAAIKRLHKKGKLKWDEAARGESIEGMIGEALSRNWEVYIEPPPDKGDNCSPETLAEYLARYFHSIAIGNYRILKIEVEGVTFRYRDNREGGKEKETTLSGVEFIRRFLLHVLPHRFVRIRHYGLHHNQAQGLRRQVRALLGFAGTLPVVAKLKLLEWQASFMEEDPNVCAHCGKGQMRLLREFGPIEGWRSLVLGFFGFNVFKGAVV